MALHVLTDAGRVACMGIEAVIVLRDICGYSAVEAIEISAWAAQAILQSELHALRLERTKLDEGGTR